MPALSILWQMQQQLVRLYDAPVEHDVRDYLVTTRRELPGCTRGTVLTDEQLILVEPAQGTDEGLQIALYIDEQVLERLDRQSPFASLKTANLADYCTAFEGVSHFHYVAWRCARGCPVSLLELEMQAEVDKYVGALLLLTAQTGGQFPRTLHQELFDQVSFAKGLDRESLARYQLANRHAARFCRFLDEHFLRKRQVRIEAWLAALRRFYRSGHCEKIRQISFA
jgi:hypothetical protein